MRYPIVWKLVLDQLDSSKPGWYFFRNAETGEHIKPFGLDYFYGFQDTPGSRLFQTQKNKDDAFKQWDYDKLLTFV